MEDTNNCCPFNSLKQASASLPALSLIFAAHLQIHTDDVNPPAIDTTKASVASKRPVSPRYPKINITSDATSKFQKTPRLTATADKIR